VRRRAESDADTERLRRPLFWKHFLIQFVAVTVPLVVSGATEAWFGYGEHRGMLD
jgi:adenylate cyclase